MLKTTTADSDDGAKPHTTVPSAIQSNFPSVLEASAQTQPCGGGSCPGGGCTKWLELFLEAGAVVEAAASPAGAVLWAGP